MTSLRPGDGNCLGDTAVTKWRPSSRTVYWIEPTRQVCPLGIRVTVSGGETPAAGG